MREGTMLKAQTHLIGVPESEDHVHPYAHILIAPSAPLQVRIGDSTYLIDETRLGIVLAGVRHQCACISSIISINIPENMIKKSDRALFERNVTFPIAGMLVPLIELIKSEVARNPDSDSLRYLYYYLYDKLVEANVPKSQRYIHEHFGEPVTIADLAQIENYNVSYYTDWFKRRLGVSPSCYLRNFRIEKAKELLLTTHYRLIEIAMQVGYNSNASFTRAFKEATGMSPIAYRSQYAASNGESEPVL
jgi:AraC-like DNA-binding protein